MANGKRDDERDLEYEQIPQDQKDSLQILIVIYHRVGSYETFSTVDCG